MASTVEEAKSYISHMDMCSIAISRYWFSVMQHHHILMQELENGVTQGEPEVHHLVSMLYAIALLKAVLPFSTSDQKPSTLCAHFTQPY